MQYESPISSGKKVMAKVKVFQKEVKLQGQGHEVKNMVTVSTLINTPFTPAVLTCIRIVHSWIIVYTLPAKINQNSFCM